MGEHFLAPVRHLGRILHDHVQLAGMDGHVPGHGQQVFAFVRVHAFQAGADRVVAQHGREAELPEQIGHKPHPQDAPLNIGRAAAQLEEQIIFFAARAQARLHGDEMKAEARMQAAIVA